MTRSIDLDALAGGGLSALLKPVDEWFPAATARHWLDQLVAVGAEDWPAVEGRALAGAVAAALDASAAARRGEPIDRWSRGFALATVLTVERATHRPCAGLDARWADGEPDLYRVLAVLADGLIAAEAREARAGPIAFFWLMRSLASHPRVIALGGEALRRYERLLRDRLASPLPAAAPRLAHGLRRGLVASGWLSGPENGSHNSSLSHEQAKDRITAYLEDATRLPDPEPGYIAPRAAR
jgi:hypothetical protein